MGHPGGLHGRGGLQPRHLDRWRRAGGWGLERSSGWREQQEQGQVGLGEGQWPPGLKWGEPGMDWGEAKARPLLDSQGLGDQSLGPVPLFRKFSQGCSEIWARLGAGVAVHVARSGLKSNLPASPPFQRKLNFQSPLLSGVSVDRRGSKTFPHLKMCHSLLRASPCPQGAPSLPGWRPLHFQAQPQSSVAQGGA